MPAIPSDPARRPPARGIKPLRRLWPLLLPYSHFLAISLLALVCTSAAMLFLPTTLKSLIDVGILTQSADRIDRQLLLFLGVTAAAVTLSSVRMYLSTWVAERIAADLRKSVYRNVVRLDQQFFASVRVGEVLSRLMADVTLVQGVLSSNALSMIGSLILVLGAFVLLVTNSAKLSMALLIAIPLLLIPLFVFGRRLRALARQTQDKLANASGFSSESLHAIPVVQAFTLEEVCSVRHDVFCEEAFDAAIRSSRLASVVTAVTSIATFASVAFTLWVGARAVAAGEMTGGELAQCMLYGVMAAQAAAGLSVAWTQLQFAGGAMERLLELESTSSGIYAKGPTPLVLPPAVAGRVDFEGIDFSYPSRAAIPALARFDLRIAPGETIALVGRSGAGKSTVFSLLLRFYDPARGRITIDGIDISQLEPEDLRRRIALVPQETVLFGASVWENIRYGRPDASDAEIVAVARAAEADAFIRELPQGYDTKIGERGIGLSPGQRQRIAVARALLKNAPILLLDEATNSLDAENERLLQNALAVLKRNRTTLVIAHRLSTVQTADRIVVLDRGVIVAHGTHDELMQQSPLYARLATLQLMTPEQMSQPAIAHITAVDAAALPL